MRFNIQSKLFLALAGLTAVLLGGLLQIISSTLTEQIEKKIIDDFRNTQRIFSEQQRLIYDRLVESCYLIGENSTFKANVSLQDPPSVMFTVDEFAQFAKVDLFIVTDASGMVLADFANPDSFGYDLSFRPSVVRAMNGIEPDATIEWPELWGYGANLFQVVTLPVYAKQTIIGTLTLGSLFTSFEAKKLKGESNIDITFYYNDQITGSSFPNPATSGIQRFARNNKALIDTVNFLHMASPAFTGKIKGDDHFAFVSPLGLGENAVYLATVPKHVELNILNTIQNNILVTAAIFLVLTIIFALILGKTFSRPILKLAAGMNKVKSGNLDVQIKATTKDEIGLLTNTFNEMISGLRERLHLRRYVGSHTLEMVKKTATRDVALGGSKHNLAVLFSDVRGFTSYSESRDPEEVITMLNRYLGFQAEIVEQYKGSVDKFVGDEMFALFTGDDALKRAVDCSIAIQQRVNEEHASDPVPIYIGIGINYGPVILGNMGAEKRMDYTAIGATVNLGARLCSAADAGKVLVPKNLLDNLNGKYKIGEIMLMSFKGISQPMKIAEVISA